MDTEGVFEAEANLDERMKNDSNRIGRAATIVTGGIHKPSNSEQTPLLPGSRDDSGTQAPDPNTWPGQGDFDGLPWWKKPSISFLLAPFLLFTLAFGGIIVVKLNLTLKLVCRDYYAEQASRHPDMSFIPIDFEHNNDQCRADAVQSRVAAFTLICNLISGILSAVVSPKLGSMSDRYGRRKIMAFTTLGILVGEIITIIAATNPATFPTEWLYLGYLIDGLCGSFITNLAIAHSYAADCTPPAERNVAFGYFHGCLFGGIAFGPLLAGLLVKATGNSLASFYAVLICHIIFMISILFIIPESLSKQRQKIAREKYDEARASLSTDDQKIMVRLRKYNLLEPLKILWPTEEGSTPALRRNLVILASIDTIGFGVAMGAMTVIVYYMGRQFGWGNVEENIMMSIANTFRVFGLLVVLPTITRMVRGPPGSRSAQAQKGCDSLDLGIIRFSLTLEVIGLLGYTLVRTGPLFIMFACIASLGGMGSPTLQSAMTKHVPHHRTGELLGAAGLLHALARIVAPAVLNAIYLSTVGKFTQTVFLVLAITFFIAFLMSCFLRSGVYLGESNISQDVDSQDADE